MDLSPSRLGLRDRVEHGPLLERLWDEGGMAQPGRKLRRTRRGHERERNTTVEEFCGNPKGFPADDIDVQQRIIEIVLKMLPGLREGFEHTHNFVPLVLEKGLQVQPNEGIVFQNKNPHSITPSI